MGHLKTCFRCIHSAVYDSKLICCMGGEKDNPHRERIPHSSTECAYFDRCTKMERDIKRDQLLEGSINQINRESK
jgi:hypothetical protein